MNAEIKTEKKEKKPEKKVSKKKLEAVRKLVELIKNNDTIIIASIKNLPSRQFQDIRKKLKEKAEVRVVKKRIMSKAIENSEEKNIEKLKEYVCEDSAILFSKLEGFELAGFLAENKNPIKAKSGQVAEEDIGVEEGPTDLIPGPAISELGNLGIKIAVEEGKIAIKEKKIIVNAGEKISGAAASIMTKLDIMPFDIGLEPIAILNKKTGKIYTEIKIDKKKTAEDLKTAASKALGFAQKIVYYCKETIGFFLGKASIDEKAFSSLIKEEKPIEKTEQPVEVKEEATEVKEEQKKENIQQEDKSEETKSKEE